MYIIKIYYTAQVTVFIILLMEKKLKKNIYIGVVWSLT